MAPPEHPLVVIGFGDDVGELREAVAPLGVSVAVIGRCDDAAGVLADTHPLAIVLRHDAPGAAQLCTQARMESRLSLVPIFSVASEASDLAFAELFVWGGDDLVAAPSSQPIVRRLRALLGQQARSGSSAGHAAARASRRAVVAGSDATWRTVVGRALYTGGFAVRFATGADTLREECSHGDVQVVVAADDLEPGGAAGVLSTFRAEGSNTAWVLVAPPKRMAAAHAAAKASTRASVADGFAPPENVLFLVNELLAARGVDKRASPRLLYGTAVSFRPAGREEDEIGYSYNVSAGGLYVRTTAPLDPGQEVWLEMWPPRAERRVRLAGTVAWKRPIRPAGGATVPAGFGAQVTHGLSGDLERWRTGYDAFANSLLGSTSTS